MAHRSAQVIRQELAGRTGRAPDLKALLEERTQDGPVGWRDMAHLAREALHEPTARPVLLMEVFAALIEAEKPRVVLDPWVSAPVLLAAAAERAVTAVGMVPDLSLLEIAQRLEGPNWILGNPLEAEIALEALDLVISQPPFGIMASSAARPEDPAVRLDATDLAFFRAAILLRPEGAAILHSPDVIFTSHRRRRLLDQLALAGIHIETVFSLPKMNGPLTSVPTSLIVFRRAESRPFRTTRIDAIETVRDAVDSRQSVGELATLDTFYGWRALVLERELTSSLGDAALRRIDEIGQVRSLKIEPGGAAADCVNAVYVPTLGFGAVIMTPPEAKPNGVYKCLRVEIDPDIALAGYVASLLSSSLGKRLRESIASGSTVPHLSGAMLGSLSIPVPPLALQKEALSASHHLNGLSAEIERARAQLWNEPGSASEILEIIMRNANSDPIERWMQTLPFPLASVLERYVVLNDADQRNRSLLHFCHVLAQFASTVLLSALRADDASWSQIRGKAAQASPPGRELFDRTDLGFWINFGRTLAKRARGLTGSSGDPIGAVAYDAVIAFSEVAFWERIDRARVLRNRGAHGGVESQSEKQSGLSELESILGELEGLLCNAFTSIDLIRVDQGSYRGGYFSYPRAQVLQGSSSTFRERLARVSTPIPDGALAFVDRRQRSAEVLVLAPLLRLGESTSNARNACYFLDSTSNSDTFSYVSYHFEDQPRLEAHDEGLLNLVVEMRAAVPTRDEA